MAQSSEITISLEHEVLANVGKHFNSPDMSDVTLKVGEASYYVNRFVLSTQSSVFYTMMMNGSWKESDQSVITLEETPECEVVFEKFLKFFYTGKLTTSNYNDMCAIHTLADKYDVSILKKGTVAVMEDVLTGKQGEAYPNALDWLPYIEQCVPKLLPICYESIQTNLIGYTMISETNNAFLERLESRHLKEILTKETNDVVALSELSIFEFVTRWVTLKFNDLSGQEAKEELKEILPLIRFNNMDGDQLMEIEESELSKAIGKSFITDYISPAYKVHAQMASIVRRDCSTCPWNSDDNCPHMNPRFYTETPYGYGGYSITSACSTVNVKPLDLSNLKMYATLRTVGEVNGQSNQAWNIQCLGNERVSNQGYHNREIFTITPSGNDIGRKFSMIISVSGPEKNSHYRYAIKHTGTVTKKRFNKATAEAFECRSPERTNGSWDISQTTRGPFWIGIAIHLRR